MRLELGGAVVNTFGAKSHPSGRYRSLLGLKPATHRNHVRMGMRLSARSSRPGRNACTGSNFAPAAVGRQWSSFQDGFKKVEIVKTLRNYLRRPQCRGSADSRVIRSATSGGGEGCAARRDTDPLRAMLMVGPAALDAVLDCEGQPVQCRLCVVGGGVAMAFSSVSVLLLLVHGAVGFPDDRFERSGVGADGTDSDGDADRDGHALVGDGC